VCSGGKLRKSSQVLYRSDQGKYFKKNTFAHICPEYGFRVKMQPLHFDKCTGPCDFVIPINHATLNFGWISPP